MDKHIPDNQIYCQFEIGKRRVLYINKENKTYELYSMNINNFDEWSVNDFMYKRTTDIIALEARVLAKGYKKSPDKGMFKYISKRKEEVRRSNKKWTGVNRYDI